MKCVAGPLGAYLYPQPARAGAPIAVLPAGLALSGEVVLGERLHDEARWVRVTGYVWIRRIIEETTPAPCLLPRCTTCGRFIGDDGAHRCQRDGTA
jgi:hypothetical protein